MPVWTITLPDLTNLKYLILDIQQQGKFQEIVHYHSETADLIFDLFGKGVEQILIQVLNAAAVGLSPITIPSGMIKNPPYSGTFSALRVDVDASGNAVHCDRISDIGILPEDLTLTSLALDPNNPGTAKVYRQLETKTKIKFTTTNPVPDRGAIVLELNGDSTFQQTSFFYKNIVSSSVLLAFDYKGIIVSLSSDYKQLALKNLRGIPAGTAIEFDIFIKTPDDTVANPGQITVDSLFYTAYYDSDLTSKIDELVVASPLTSAPLRGFKRFIVNQPVQWDTTPGAGYVGPLNMFLQPLTPNPDGFVISFQNEFKTPNGPQDSVVCLVGSNKAPCKQVSIPAITGGTQLQIRVDLQSNGGIPLSNLVSTPLEFSTDFITPTNGIKLPSQGGYYWIKVDVCSFTAGDDASCTVLEKYSDFIFIYPKEFISINVQSEAKTAGQYNVFQFQFVVNQTIPAYVSGSTMLLEFPTQQKDPVTGNLIPSFQLDLGTGKQTGDPVGCWVDPSCDLKTQRSEFTCILIKSQVIGSPAYIEILNFDALTFGNLV